jgi:L-malate glycosyltransferase
LGRHVQKKRRLNEGIFNISGNFMMRVMILTPTAFPSISGNAVTVERWRQALMEKGILVDVLASAGLDPFEFEKRLQQFGPDLIHVHHAYKAGILLLNPRISRQKKNTAIVVSPGGTDINEDLVNPERSATVLQVFQMARIIVVQNPALIQRFRQLFPDSMERIVYVPKVVCWFGNEAYDLRKAVECNSEDILFFLPSGVRPVKGNIECLELMKRVHKLRPKIRFVAAGPALDANYADRLEREMFPHSYFARWIPSIPPAAMRSAFRSSDIVLNSSYSEGLSNSLMEALAECRPILASNIAGNRWPVLGENGDAPAGLLFDLQNPEDFLEKALALIDDDSLRASLSQAAFSRNNRQNNPENEIAALIAAYQAALGYG